MVPNESPAVDVGLAEVDLLLGVAEVAHGKGDGGDSSSEDELLHKIASNPEFTIQRRKQNIRNPKASESNPASETHPASDTPRPKRTRK